MFNVAVVVVIHRQLAATQLPPSALVRRGQVVAPRGLYGTRRRALVTAQVQIAVAAIISGIPLLRSAYVKDCHVDLRVNVASMGVNVSTADAFRDVLIVRMAKHVKWTMLAIWVVQHRVRQDTFDLAHRDANLLVRQQRDARRHVVLLPHVFQRNARRHAEVEALVQWALFAIHRQTNARIQPA